MWAGDWELARRIPGLILTQPFEERTQIIVKESLSIEPSHSQLKSNSKILYQIPLGKPRLRSEA